PTSTPTNSVPPTNTGGNTGGTTTTGGSDTATNTVSSTNDVVWINDALPAGAIPDVGGGDSWSWVTSNPNPQLGAQAHQSAIGSGVHQHFFTGATAPMQVNAGDKLYTYVYVDPANPPTEIMFQWNDGTSWEHRAYWGANSVAWGTDTTPSLFKAGTIPAAGQWARLEVPASSVGLEGASVSGMAFTLYGGRVTFDNSGKTSVTNSAPTNSTGGTGDTKTNTGSTGDTNTNSSGTNALSNTSVWFDDALPLGAVMDWNVDSWNWVSTSPYPQSGTRAHQSAAAAGLHQHFFYSAAQTMTPATGDVLYTWVYIDPANVPSELMLHGNDGSTWDHRA